MRNIEQIARELVDAHHALDAHYENSTAEFRQGMFERRDELLDEMARALGIQKPRRGPRYGRALS